MTRWEGDKGGRAPASYRGKESIDREARVLAEWAEGRVASEIGEALGVSRNVIIGIVHRSKGENADAAKRMHIAARGSGRVTESRPRREYADKHRKVVSAGALAELITPEKPPKKYGHDLSGQALADRRAECKAKQLAAVAKVELTLIDNPGFVAKVEKPWDPYSHMRSEGGLSRALEGLSR